MPSNCWAMALSVGFKRKRTAQKIRT